MLHYLFNAEKKRRAKVLEAAPAEAENKPVAAGGKGSTECIICMKEVATVVYVPCNHMLAC